jgi:membrane peptidoglycan carboxypeptidase
VNLMELANAYRTMASGILNAQPYVIRRIVRDSGEVMAESEHASSPVHVEGFALLLIQEGMRGVVRIAHRHGSRTGLQQLPDCRDGEDWNNE